MGFVGATLLYYNLNGRGTQLQGLIWVIIHNNHQGEGKPREGRMKTSMTSV